MANECPSCGNLVSASAAACKQCGAELPERGPVRLKQDGTQDAVKYGIIITVLLAIVTGLYLLNSGMGMSARCESCAGRGVVICVNCKDGRPKCLSCAGRGQDPQNFSTCTVCQGRGQLAECPKCKGNPKRRCSECGGRGKITK